jgi:hypothetical protein
MQEAMPFSRLLLSTPTHISSILDQSKADLRAAEAELKSYSTVQNPAYDVEKPYYDMCYAAIKVVGYNPGAKEGACGCKDGA